MGKVKSTYRTLLANPYTTGAALVYAVACFFGEQAGWWYDYDWEIVQAARWVKALCIVFAMLAVPYATHVKCDTEVKASRFFFQSGKALAAGFAAWAILFTTVRLLKWLVPLATGH